MSDAARTTSQPTFRHVELWHDDAAGGWMTRYRDPARGGYFVTGVGHDVSVATQVAAAFDALVESYTIVSRRPTETYPKLPYVSFYELQGKKGSRFQVSYNIPGYPRRTDRLGTNGRTAYKFAEKVSETLEMVKSRLISPADAHKRLCIDRRPIAVHVEAYERHLTTQGVSKDYRASTIHRLKECIDLAGIARYEHVTRQAVGTILEKLRERETLTSQTINGYLKALKQFTRWMARSGRVSDDPLHLVEGVQVGAEEGRRRDATIEEVKWICAGAMGDTVKRRGRLNGPDRAMLYLFAFCTGLRADECRVAQVGWLKLAGDTPVLSVPGNATKNTKPATQPLPGWFASAISTWLGERSAGPLFPGMHQDMCRPFAKDLARARALWLKETAKDDAKKRKQLEASEFLQPEAHDGKLVFHSFRHGYASELLGSDAEAKLVQSLVRHSTITLLFDRYGHARRGKAHEAVERAFPRMIPEAQNGAAPSAAQ